MGSLFRSILGVPVAAVIVIGLFLLMYGLIRVDEVPPPNEGDPVNINIGRQIEDSAVQNQKRFERPSLDQPPPPPPAINQQTFRPTVDAVPASTPNFSANVDLGSAFNPDRDAQPLVRLEPQNWDRCIDKDGYSERVTVEFDVTPEGQTTNINIVASSDSCLNRAARRAVQRWKYQPKIEDGEAKPRFGVRTQFTFQSAE